jgi:hypothetical protein
VSDRAALAIRRRAHIWLLLFGVPSALRLELLVELSSDPTARAIAE